MRFEQLRYLEAALRTGAFRRAAAELGVAQPSLSQQIQRLEEELDAVLLVRTPSGVRPTDACRTLMPHVIAALQAEEALLQEASALGKLDRGRIRIGAVGLPTRVILPRAARAFQQAYPGVHLQAHEGYSEMIRSQLRDGLLDVGLISRFSDEVDVPTDLRYDDLVLDRPLHVGVPADHRLSGREHVSPQDLAGESFIATPPGHMLRTAMHRYLGDSMRIVYVTDTVETVRVMVSAGVGVSILHDEPDTVSSSDRGIWTIPIDETWARCSITVVRRAHEMSSPAVRVFLDILATEAARLSS